MVVFIDGPDGSGKGTILERLKELHPDIEVVRFPGARQSKVCSTIRDIVLNTELDPEVSYLLFWADIYQGFLEVVRPRKDKIVLLDRWITSTYVYQVMMRAIPEKDFLRDLGEFYVRNREYWPDYGIYLKIDADTIKKRLATKSLEEPLNQYDNMVLDNLEDIIRYYDGIMKIQESSFDTKMIHIDARDKVEDTINKIENIIFKNKEGSV